MGEHAMTAWVDPRAAHQSQSLELISWKPPLDRLEHECEVALRSGRSDPWALAEVACWIDLLDAEMAAARHRADDVSVGLLGRWRDRLETIETRLRVCNPARKGVSEGGRGPHKR